jgi:hypothetical protein
MMYIYIYIYIYIYTMLDKYIMTFNIVTSIEGSVLTLILTSEPIYGSHNFKA